MNVGSSVFLQAEGLAWGGSVKEEEGVAVDCEWQEKITEIPDSLGQYFLTYHPHNIGVLFSLDMNPGDFSSFRRKKSDEQFNSYTAHKIEMSCHFYDLLLLAYFIFTKKYWWIFGPCAYHIFFK